MDAQLAQIFLHPQGDGLAHWIFHAEHEGESDGVPFGVGQAAVRSVICHPHLRE